MPSCSTAETARRAKALLGTLVSIDAEGEDAARACDAAFAEIARVHALMSFHEPASDLSKLNRDAYQDWVQVDPSVVDVLRFALGLSVESEGAFDVSIAQSLVEAGQLPSPNTEQSTNPAASWRDIEIDQNKNAVRFHKALWIDLGGVAKGYAVDRAIEILQRAGCTSGCVNAGGDLSVFGPREETVLLRQPEASGEAPIVQLSDGALASSAATPGIHFNGRAQTDASAFSFVSVLAPSCMTADALTKVVLAQGQAAEPVLRRFQAHAYVRGQTGWRSLGEH